MSLKIRTEVLNATQKAFGSLKYGVIGGTALAQYGNRRATSDVDVMVPEDVINVIEDRLIKHGMVRTAGKGIGYVHQCVDLLICCALHYGGSLLSTRGVVIMHC